MLMVVARYFFIVPMLRARRYTQVRVSRKIRHFGRDAEIQAMDGHQSVVQVLDSGDLPARSFMDMDTRTPVAAKCCHPWTLDSGIPDRNDGLPTFVYNGVRSPWERLL